MQRGGKTSCFAGKLIFWASLRQEEEAQRRRGWKPEVGRLERRREAAGERGWKNGQRAVRLREEAKPEWTVGEVYRRTWWRRRKRRAPPPSRRDTGFDFVLSLSCSSFHTIW